MAFEETSICPNCYGEDTFDLNTDDWYDTVFCTFCGWRSPCWSDEAYAIGWYMLATADDEVFPNPTNLRIPSYEE